jgi:hypothetical protein
MSNKSEFTSKIKELGHTKSDTQLKDFFDGGKTESTFYKRLIDLFSKLKNDNNLKDCKFDFNKSTPSADNKFFYIYLKGDCLNKLKNSDVVKSSGLKFDADTSSLGMLAPTQGQQTTTGETEQQKELAAKEAIKQSVYGAIADKALPGLTDTSGLTEAINRIKKIMNG